MIFRSFQIPATLLPNSGVNTHTRPLTKHRRRFYLNHPGAQGLRPLVRSRAPAVETKKKSPTSNTKNPHTMLPESPGGSGATPAGTLARTRCQDKNPQTILPESPRGSGAPVGFINPWSLMDLLPSKSSAQQMMLRTTRDS
jgi:hypothetical protein